MSYTSFPRWAASKKDLLAAVGGGVKYTAEVDPDPFFYLESDIEEEEHDIFPYPNEASEAMRGMFDKPYRRTY